MACSVTVDGVADRLLRVARGRRLEPFALALAFGLDLSPKAQPGGRVVNGAIEYCVTDELADQQSDVLRAVVAWQLRVAGLRADHDSITHVCGVLERV